MQTVSDEITILVGTVSPVAVLLLPSVFHERKIPGEGIGLLDV